MKIGGLRFDIDNLSDATDGLYNLKNILCNHKTRCTLFINMGRSISYSTLIYHIKETLYNLKGKSKEGKEKIGVLKKLGNKKLLQTLIINPFIGKHGIKFFKIMKEDGNELSLHGGKNHTKWQKNGTKMSPQNLSKELKWGKECFEKLLDIKPQGFSCPGFNSPYFLEDELVKLDFIYHSDLVGVNELLPKKNKIYDIPVNVVGKETIPIIEHFWAKGINIDEIPTYIYNRFEEIYNLGGIPVIYGHPSVEGKLLKEIFEDVLRKLLLNEWKLVPLIELLNI